MRPVLSCTRFVTYCSFRELLPHVQRDDPRLEFPILANLVEVLTRAGKVDDAVEMGLDAVERATAAGYKREMLAIGMNSLDALITNGQLDEAERIGRLSAEVAVKLQHQVQLGFLSNSLCLLALRTGSNTWPLPRVPRSVTYA